MIAVLLIAPPPLFTPHFTMSRREWDARRLHSFAARYQRTHGYPPRMRDMARYLGCSGSRLFAVLDEAQTLGLMAEVGRPRQTRAWVAL